MITNFGKEIRKIRIEKNENMVKMAEKLKMSISYLSSIENGKRAIPDDMIDKLKTIYDLDEKEMQKLNDMKNSELTKVSIDLTATDTYQNDVAIALARKIKWLTEDDCQDILNIIDNKEEKNE